MRLLRKIMGLGHRLWLWEQQAREAEKPPEPPKAEELPKFASAKPIEKNALKLGEREAKIIVLLKEGRSNAEIAREIGLNPAATSKIIGKLKRHGHI